MACTGCQLGPPSQQRGERWRHGLLTAAAGGVLHTPVLRVWHPGLHSPASRVPEDPSHQAAGVWRPSAAAGLALHGRLLAPTSELCPSLACHAAGWLPSTAGGSDTCRCCYSCKLCCSLHAPRRAAAEQTHTQLLSLHGCCLLQHVLHTVCGCPCQAPTDTGWRPTDPGAQPQSHGLQVLQPPRSNTALGGAMSHQNLPRQAAAAAAAATGVWLPGWVEPHHRQLSSSLAGPTRDPHSHQGLVSSSLLT